ncbi:MAG: DUF370 domain-containing protein [Lachnospiraceae bacterium]|nr:DUF370 domain-containing protein [Lachnospiraceae bacterium]MDE5908459.1 DUF370 domain-containing protein [Lachnospiraceae bacterium]MDE6185894.1 DUF370 domain-containing protein [Lachnospiraceae bacterium]MDE7286067.1 DUF370 domain-containing protein [Lachnospiraceae bacterium]
MEQLINIGFGNFVNRYKIIAVISPDSAPAKRMIQNGKDQGTVIDATQGRRTRAIIVMENANIVLSAVLPETIAGRCVQAQPSAGQ